MLELKPLLSSQLSAAVALDQQALGGFWSLEGYHQELERANSVFLGITSEKRPAEEKSIGAGEILALSSTPPPLLVGMGCLWGILDEAHITLLVVHPEYRRQGFGHALLGSLLQMACQQGLARSTLEVRISNQAAILLYQQFGFEAAGQRRHYYKDNGEDALILWRSGLQTAEFGQSLGQWQQQNQTRIEQAGWQLNVLLEPISPIPNSSTQTTTPDPRFRSTRT